MTRAHVLVLTAVVALLLVAVPAAPAATEKACDDVPGAVDAPQDVRALNVGCTAARRLAKWHSNHSGRNERCSLAKKACTHDGWRCTRTFFGNSGTRVRCTKGSARVRFFYGS